MNYLRYVVKEEDDQREVLHILRGDLLLSTKKIRSVKYLERGILLDGERVTVRKRVEAGQILQVLLDDVDHQEETILATPMGLEILYEDSNMIFLNKPAGVVSHPSRGHVYDSLLNGLQSYYQEKGEASSLHLVGRLDKDTSGVLLVAKNSVTKERLQGMRQRGESHKEYLALVQGHLTSQEGFIDIPMEEYREGEQGHILRMRRPRNSQGAIQAGTHFKVLKERAEYSLISLWLETGRMHQIRYHMSEIGHPLLGDAMYGSGLLHSQGMERTALHARRVSFQHPFTGERIDIQADLPADMKRLI